MSMPVGGALRPRSKPSVRESMGRKEAPPDHGEEDPVRADPVRADPVRAKEARIPSGRIASWGGEAEGAVASQEGGEQEDMEALRAASRGGDGTGEL